MCLFFSGVVDKKGFIYAGDGEHHYGIETAYKLRPGSYREFEWEEDDKGETLEVRMETGDKENYFKALILGKYPMRKKLLKALPIGRAENYIYYLRNGIIHRNPKEGPAFIDFDTPKITFVVNGKDCRMCKNGPTEIGLNFVRLNGVLSSTGASEPLKIREKVKKWTDICMEIVVKEYEKHHKKPVSKQLLKTWRSIHG